MYNVEIDDERLEREMERAVRRVEINEAGMKDYELLDKIDFLGTKMSYPMMNKEIKEYEYDFIKSYLFALYAGVLKSQNFKVMHLATMGPLSTPIIVPPTITDSDERGMVRLKNDVVYAFVEYEKAQYQLTVYSKLYSSLSEECRCFFGVLGTGPNSGNTGELFEWVINEAVRHSYFKNKIVNMSFEDRDAHLEIVSANEFADESLDSVFLPENVKTEINRFCESVKHYSQLGLGLRYLFSGEPGTGKTKTIRALINACYGNATILLLRGEIKFKKLFEFAELLTPTIICLDDIDLNIGTRDNVYSPSSLSAFLQEMDGFRKNQLFVLATTNDKELVDEAASRPGRFDMILDFSRIDKRNYKLLINSQCNDPELLQVFDDELLSILRSKKVTGAFISNLIKQLRVMKAVKPEEDMRKYAKALVGTVYKGFYKKQEEKEMAFGFNGHDD